MSWTVAAVGKSAAVAVAIEGQFNSSGLCIEPEEGIRQSARALIAQSLAGQIPGCVVKVAASGSQSTAYGKAGAPDAVTNSLSIAIEPQGNFVE